MTELEVILIIFVLGLSSLPVVENALEINEISKTKAKFVLILTIVSMIIAVILILL